MSPQGRILEVKESHCQRWSNQFNKPTLHLLTAWSVRGTGLSHGTSQRHTGQDLFSRAYRWHTELQAVRQTGPQEQKKEGELTFSAVGEKATPTQECERWLVPERWGITFREVESCAAWGASCSRDMPGNLCHVGYQKPGVEVMMGRRQTGLGGRWPLTSTAQVLIARTLATRQFPSLWHQNLYT